MNRVSTEFKSAKNGFGPTRIAQKLTVSIIWPFFSAVIDILRYPRRRAFLGIAVFCAYAGWVFAPTLGSDAHTYAMRILDLQAGYGARISEPVIRAIAYPIAYLAIDIRFYFLALGLLYAAFLNLSLTLIFEDLPRDYRLSLAAIIFLFGFVLYYPLFASLNARFTLGMWACFASALFWIRGRWWPAVAIAFVGVMVHYGLVLFVAALLLSAVSRRLLNLQAPFAYLVVLVAAVLPAGLVLNFGDAVAGVFGGTFSEKIAENVAIGIQIYEGDRVRGIGDSDRAWYFRYFALTLFSSLMISGHYLWLRYLKVRSDPIYQLWVLIILLTAISISVVEIPEAAGRVRRIVTGLLLLFHALWFIRRLPASRLVVAFNLVPILFFFAVGYRIWLHQVSVAAFLLLPFGLVGDFWPRVLELIGFE